MHRVLWLRLRLEEPTAGGGVGHVVSRCFSRLPGFLGYKCCRLPLRQPEAGEGSCGILVSHLRWLLWVHVFPATMAGVKD